MDAPLAYLLTFRTYGTWPPGDERGYVDHARRGAGASAVGHNPWKKDVSTALMSAAPRALDPAQRSCVHAEIEQTCRLHNWYLHALNVRTNHVHLVISAGEPPEQLLASLKAWATRRLRGENLVAHGERVWARHGSTRYLRDLASMEAACDYVTNWQ